MKRKKYILLFGLLAFFVLGFAAEFSVVVHPDNPTTEINASDLQNIYLGRKSTWDDGKPIEVLVLKEGDVHSAFLKEVVKKSPSQFAIFWKKAVFTGTGTPPKEFATEDELLAYLANHPQAVGYVSAGKAETAKSLNLIP